MKEMFITILLNVLLSISMIRCQCSNDWFGSNCSQINLCQYNNSSQCPDNFHCQTIDDNYQECLAIGTFQGNTSQLRAQWTHRSYDRQLSIRFRAHQQSTHLFTIRNIDNDKFLSIHLAEKSFVYNDDNRTQQYELSSNNATSPIWTTLHLEWSNQSLLVINNDHLTYTVDANVNEIFLFNQTMEILLGNGFRGCIEYVLIGSHIYVPFYNQTLLDRNSTRSNFITVEQLDHVEINNCTFDNVCQDVHCQHGQCTIDFDRGQCQCDHGWQGVTCEINIDECQLENNCSQQHSICQDQLDGYYTCLCHQGFTGQ
jgi:hypothetical protein